MPIRLFKPLVREDAIAAATAVMRSGWLGMGPQTTAFEAAFATFLHVSHAVGVNTGTSAVHLAIKLANLPPAAEVITSPLTFVGANQTLLYERLVPVFADIDPRTGNLTPESVAPHITPRTAGILLVHFGGYPCDLDGFADLARRHNLAIIEDCAHACGATYKHHRIGASGNLCAFSFDPIKNLTAGEGGAVIPATAAQDQRARALRIMGMTRDAFTRVGHGGTPAAWEYDVPEIGYRYHMNDLAAAIALSHLPLLDADNARRTQIAQRYHARLAGVPGITLPRYAPDRQSAYHLAWILADDRPALIARLAAAGILTGIHYARNDVYRIFQPADTPLAGEFCRRVLSLPLHLELSDAEVDLVCDVICQR